MAGLVELSGGGFVIIIVLYLGRESEMRRRDETLMLSINSDIVYLHVSESSVSLDCAWSVVSDRPQCFRIRRIQLLEGLLNARASYLNFRAPCWDIFGFGWRNSRV